MRSIFVVTAMLAVATTPAFSQDLSVEGALEIQTKASAGDFAGRSEWVAMTYYLQGIVEGFGTYQDALKDAGKQTAFCPPQNKSYSIEEMMQAIQAAPRKDRARNARDVVLEHYAEAYPCQD